MAKNAKFVQDCYEQVWKLHKSALASPSCHALTYGNTFPLSTDLLVHELSETVPLSRARREDVERLRVLASERFVPVR